MRMAVAVVTAVATDAPAEQLAGQVQAALGGGPADLCFAFASAHFEDTLETLAEEIHDRLPARTMAGVTAEAVIVGDHEYECQPALALWAARLPGVHVCSFHLSAEDLERLETPEQLQEHLNVPAGSNPSFILLADPFTFNPTPALLTLLERLEAAYPGRPVLGGLASAADAPGQNRLIFDGQTLRHGLVGVALWGNIHVDTVVSQGCRPIGHHMVVTRADGNIIYELGGRPPLEVVKQMLVEIGPRDRQLLQRRGLLVGRAINEYQPRFAARDFLIRDPLGFDAASGAMAVNDLIRTGQTVQFHVRDGATAAEDLDSMLSTVRRRPAKGALLFTCNGRGTRLFGHRHHDARMVQDAAGAIPAAGFFCAGEIGPVGRRNFLHGHTASIGFFRPTHPERDV
jgi:small ligand-binding sensory domain FIST